MIKKIKKGLAVLAASAMAVGSLSGCAEKVIDCEETVATYGDEAMDMGVAAFYVRYQQAQIYYMYTNVNNMSANFDTIFDEEEYLTLGEVLKKDMLTSLEDMMILKSHAEEYGIEITEEERAEIEEVVDAFAEVNDPEVLKAIGTCEEDIEEYLLLQLYKVKVYEAMTAEVDTSVTDEEVSRSKLTSVRFSLAGTTDSEGNAVPLTEDEIAYIHKNADRLLDKIKAQDDIASADMDALAKEVDEELAQMVYTYYAYQDDNSHVDAALLEAVEGLEDGTLVEQVVESSDGTALYVVRFDAKVDEEATQTKLDEIITERKDEMYSELLEEWRADSKFEVVEKVWDQLVITEDDIYTFVSQEEE